MHRCHLIGIRVIYYSVEQSLYPSSLSFLYKSWKIKSKIATIYVIHVWKAVKFLMRAHITLLCAVNDVRGKLLRKIAIWH